MASIIDELVTLLGFELKPNTQQTIQKFEKGLDAVRGTAMVLASAITAAAASVAYFTEKVSTSAAELDKYSELTGASVEEIQRWGYAAEQAGGSAKSVKSDIEGLLEAMNPVMPGDFNQGLFLLGMYGQKYKSMSEMMLALSDKFQGMSAMQQMGWARKMGLSSETLLLMKKGRAGIQELMGKTPFLMNKEQTESARKFEAQIHRLRYTVGALGELVITKTLPTITKLVDKFERWAASSKVDEVVQKLIDILSDPKLIGGTITAALAGVITATAILEAKWLLIASAIAMAVLAVEDFIETSQGVKNTLGNRIINFLDEHGGNYTEKQKEESKARIAKRNAEMTTGEKSTLIKSWEIFNGLVDKLHQAPATNTTNSQATTINNNVTNNVQVEGTGTAYGDANTIADKLNRLQWNQRGDLGPAIR